MPQGSAVLLGRVIGISDGDTLTARCRMSQGMQNPKVTLAEIVVPVRPWTWRRERRSAGQSEATPHGR